MALSKEATGHKLRLLRKEIPWPFKTSPDSDITGSKLPCNEQVLAYFVHQNQGPQRNASFDEVANIVYHRVEQFWKNAGIPIKHRRCCKKMLEALVQKWKSSKKNLKSVKPGHIASRNTFLKSMTKLFDISAPDAIQQIQQDRLRSDSKKNEDIMFLKQQQENHTGYMASVDKSYSSKVEQREKRKQYLTCV
jgi:hypothetical protein